MAKEAAAWPKSKVKDALAEIGDQVSKMEGQPTLIEVRPSGSDQWICRVYLRGSDEFEGIQVRT